MTDKEKIRAEIERLKQYAESSKMEWIDDGYNQNAFAETCRISSFDKLLSFIDSLPEENIRSRWKWIDPKYEYPLCLTREMDEYGDWHYSLSSGKISETCQYISLAQLERLPDEPVDADAAMKELDEKIKLTKEHGSWKGVDVDKFMDEVRGRESDDLEEAAEEYALNVDAGPYYNSIAMYGFMAGAVWQKKRFEAEYELDWITDLKKDLYELGRKDMRAQMMEGAVEGEVYKNGSESFVMSDYFSNHGIKDKQKVKLIIIPDDETLNL